MHLDELEHWSHRRISRSHELVVGSYYEIHKPLLKSHAFLRVPVAHGCCRHLLRTLLVALRERDAKAGGGGMEFVGW